jgi:carbamoyl-phosphate synthase small subunit
MNAAKDTTSSIRGTPAMLALEDGTVFPGQGFGAAGERYGEVVFNTSMTGYQEVLTDPSYRGQIVAMTYPLIGNYGITADDAESRSVWLEGFVVKELSRTVSNWRATEDVDGYLRRNGATGIEGIDTRELTKLLRTAGALKGVISTIDLEADSLVAKARASAGLDGRDLVKTVTVEKPYSWPLDKAQQAPAADNGLHVAVFDCGVKYGILRRLAQARRSAPCSAES